MKLRRLRLNGFKTFARRSEIEVGRGITAIVGPNGSGKSNVVDALRWALGETNARELRGARMDEVIYSGGTGKRGRMAVAEVEMIFDHDDAPFGEASATLAGVEGAEISITRRVTRGGASEYRVNGERVRLRDLEQLLGTTGLTQSGYSVMSQNDIDGIIAATPTQRRALVEQAAGVRAVRAGAEDAVDRIQRAEMVLRRLDDLLDEGEPRLAELALQAELALEQRHLAERLTELRGSLAREEWRAARGQLKQARRRLEAAATRAAAAAEAQAAFAERHGQQRELVALARENQRNAISRLEAARLAAERAAGEARRWADRQRAGVVNRSLAAAEMTTTASELASAESALADVESTDVEARWRSMAEQLASLRENHHRSLETARHAERAEAEAEAALAAAEATYAAALEGGREAKSRLETIRAAVAGVGRDLTEAAAELKELVRREAAVQAAESEGAATIEMAEARLTKADEILAETRLAAEQSEQRREMARDAASLALARAASLHGQIAGALGGSGAVSAAVETGELNGRRLLDCLRVRDPADATAIEAALEGHLGAWLVADLKVASSYLQSGNPREEILASGATSSDVSLLAEGRWAVDAVEIVDENARGALERCLRSFVLVENTAVATEVVRNSGLTAVLPDGTAIWDCGVRGGGRPGHTLGLAEEERQAESDAEAAAGAEQTATALLLAAVEHRRLAEELASRALTAVNQARLAAATVTAQRLAATAAVATARQRLDVLETGRRQRDAELGHHQAAAEVSLGQAQRAEVAVEQCAHELAQVGARAVVCRQGELELAERLRSAETEASELRAAASDVERRRSMAVHMATAVAARCVQAELRTAAAESDVMAAMVRGARARADTRDLSEDVAVARQAVEAGSPSLGEAERLLAMIEADRSEVAIAVARASDEEAAARADTSSAEARVAELADAVRETDEDEGPEPDALAAEKAEREILRLERRISALGPVNGLAPEQHSALATRVIALRSDRDDIGAACLDIRKLAALLGDEAERRFDSVFEAVAFHFQELFAELFPGGRATLRLEEIPAPEPGDEEAEEPSRARRLPGVEILAQPAGKRLQPLSLLSGGERALTALATILAMQHVNPSPFYVFDEVDAPLDDSNIIRFTRLMKRLASQDQQFLVVTHNHATMAAADVLYGVTIDADGISNVLSVRLGPEGGAIPEREVVGTRQSTIPVPVG